MDYRPATYLALIARIEIVEPLHRAATELLQLEQHRLPEGPLAIIGDLNADDASAIAHARAPSNTQFYVRYFGDMQEYTRCGLHVRTGWHPDENADVRCAVVFQSREKDVTMMRVAAVCAACHALDEILVVGHKKLGTKSMLRRFRPWFEEVDKMASARHCVLFRLAVPREESIPQKDAWADWHFDLDGRTVQMWDLPGVFCRGALDRGSEMLIANLADVGDVEILDLGAGGGVLSVACGLRATNAQLTLLEHDDLAVQSARRNLKLHDLTERSRVIFGDIDTLDARRFDLVVTNPPFHAGSEMTTATAERWFAAVGARLRRGGELRIVANRHLPYAGPLGAAFREVRTLDEDTKFRVWSAQGPK